MLGFEKKISEWERSRRVTGDGEGKAASEIAMSTNDDSAFTKCRIEFGSRRYVGMELLYCGQMCNWIQFPNVHTNVKLIRGIGTRL